jgi:peptide/nickel transport system permease protein
MASKFKYSNWLFISGITGVCIFAILAIIGPSIAPFDVDFSENFIDIETEDGPDLLIAPHKPSARHPFGTDHWGYDLLTLMLHGAKYTVFVPVLIAALRTVLAILVGIIAGKRKRRLRSSRAGISGITFLNSIPGFIILYYLLYPICFNPTISILGMIVIQSVLIALIGSYQGSVIISSKINHIRSLPFIEAAESIGAGRWRIVFRHIVPQLKEDFLLLFTQEIVSVLSLIGVLAIFNIFLGGTKMTQNPVLFHSITHEWAGFVGQYYANVRSVTWMLFIPLSGYLLLLIAFSAVTRGFEHAYNVKHIQNRLI